MVGINKIITIVSSKIFFYTTKIGANILVDNFTCYGSHGLSVSLGFSNDTYELNVLQNVTFKNSFMNGGTNGIHIKTHTDGGNGLLQNITYENIEING